MCWREKHGEDADGRHCRTEQPSPQFPDPARENDPAQHERDADDQHREERPGPPRRPMDQLPEAIRPVTEEANTHRIVHLRWRESTVKTPTVVTAAPSSR